AFGNNGWAKAPATVTGVATTTVRTTDAGQQQGQRQHPRTLSQRPHKILKLCGRNARTRQALGHHRPKAQDQNQQQA
ncbi:hypothetical protein BGZ54_000933, partial [Gamsiella multidivaricata]